MKQSQLPVELSADKQRTAYKRCIGQLIEKLEDTTNLVFDKVAANLFELASGATSNVEQSRYFEGMRTLEQARDKVTRGFLENQRRRTINFYQSPVDPGDDAATPELSDLQLNQMKIVDDRDLAQTLTVEAMADSAEVRYSRPLFALSTRLGLLLKRAPLSNVDNPFAPRAISECFCESLTKLEVELEVLLTVFKVFDRQVMHRLGQIYEQLNEQLASIGIAPNLKAGLAKRPPSRKAKPTLEAEPEAEPETALKTERERSQQETPEQSAASDRTIAAQEQHEIALYESIQELLSDRRAATPAPNQPVEVIDTPALIDALSGLQQQLASERRLTAEFVKQQLLDQFNPSSSDAATGLVTTDEDMVDTVGMMFDFIGEDAQLPKPFQQALSKLQIPFLQASLKQRELFQSPQSAPRQLLTELGQLGQGWNDQSDRGQRVVSTINDMVSDISENYSQDDGIFERKLDELRDFSKKHERRAKVRAKREQEAFEGREKLSSARSTVARQLLEYRGDRQLPPLVGELLEKSWAHVMVLALLRHGKDSPQWKQADTAAKELIWSVTFDHKQPDSVKRLRTTLPLLGKTLATGLREVGYHDDEIRKVLDSLKQTYKGVLSDDRIVIESSTAGLIIRGESVLSEDELANLQDVNCAEELAELLGEVHDWKPGQWVLFNRDEQEPLRAKLSWISPITGRYLFVDQQGQKAVEKTASELAKEVEEHQVEKMDDSDLYARALSGVAHGLSTPSASQGAPA